MPSGPTISCEIDMLSIRWPDAAPDSMSEGRQDLLDIEPLSINVDIALPVAGKLEAKVAGRDRKVQKALADIAKEAREIVEKAVKDADGEFKKLLAALKELKKKDDEGDEKAGKQAAAEVKKAVARIEDIVDDTQPKLRQMVEKEIKDIDLYKNARLHAVGNTGFRTDKGMWLKSGQFVAAEMDGDDEATGAELRKAIAAAKNASNSNPYDFVLASGREAGLVIRKRATGSDRKTALQRREGGGGLVYYGEIRYEKSKYVFVLDKDCSVGQGAKLAKQIQLALKEATGKRYALRVEGQGYGEDEEGDA